MDEILKRLESLHPKIIDLKLDRVERLLRKLGNPERSLPPVIHVAGTNGKGSTIAMIKAGLQSSGLKTHVGLEIKKQKLSPKLVSEISFEFENAILDVLISKTLSAAQKYEIDNIVIVGGVSANKKLRKRFQKEKGSRNIFFPDISFSTDNGAMIAFMGYLKSSDSIENSLEIKPSPVSRLI